MLPHSHLVGKSMADKRLLANMVHKQLHRLHMLQRKLSRQLTARSLMSHRLLLQRV